MRLHTMVVYVLAISILTSGCSAILAANRSSYRGDVNVIREGVSRSEVIGELGEPDSFSKLENGWFDDRYTLDPDAHRTWVKVGTVLLHAGADIFTLFLWELVGTPYEIAMRDKIAVYHLAYNPEGKLSKIEKIKP
jgi:hypothetical protein